MDAADMSPRVQECKNFLVGKSNNFMIASLSIFLLCMVKIYFNVFSLL